MDTHTPWHRLLGMALTDLLTGCPWRVELETELALKSQRLDLLIIERGSSGAAPENADILDNDWPDGLDNLAAHNLMTYKSHQENLDAWALEELTGHYVTYCLLPTFVATLWRPARHGDCFTNSHPEPGTLPPGLVSMIWIWGFHKFG